MYADAKLRNNALRPPFSTRQLLCGLPSVTIQTDRVRSAFGRVNPQSETTQNRPSAGFFRRFAAHYA